MNRNAPNFQTIAQWVPKANKAWIIQKINRRKICGGQTSHFPFDMKCKQFKCRQQGTQNGILRKYGLFRSSLFYFWFTTDRSHVAVHSDRRRVFGHLTFLKCTNCFSIKMHPVFFFSIKTILKTNVSISVHVGLRCCVCAVFMSRTKQDDYLQEKKRSLLFCKKILVVPLWAMKYLSPLQPFQTNYPANDSTLEPQSKEDTVDTRLLLEINLLYLGAVKTETIFE